ncbi:MAG: DUF4062 domain-containing protein, partial [Verrucomicrobiota bacterium]
MKNDTHKPLSTPQVMVSSTFLDLEEHRAAVIQGIQDHKLHANVMEHHNAVPNHDVIDSSLKMVRDSAAYILVIGLKYGQIPQCSERNPNQLSITELEFHEAQRCKRPILLFIMGEEHDVKRRDIESDVEKEKRLNDFRERAKQWAPESAVNRVFCEFNSLAEFQQKIAAPLSDLRQLLVSPVGETTTVNDDSTLDVIPSPPTFYAQPDYIGSHQFVGRIRELEDLSDWAKSADPTNLLLYEAIGGNGKSMLTWEWTTKHATQIREDWAGRFWYSFYERGAVMADFCRHALAYMTSQPLDAFERKGTPDLAEELLAQLKAQPWLLILDGLERVLVAYHRIDAAEVPDEEANAPTDQIADRNPCDAIRDEDNELLRALAAASPSKILISSRLTPRVLLNLSGQPISGAKRITLPGLRPLDAEQLLRSCGVRGDSETIQQYLTENCDNHPLVIGVLAGIITNYLPDRGNFDSWLKDTGPKGGAQLDIASLDLIQRRNHILRTALEALPEKARQLLSTLALLSEAIDYETLAAFNPHLPPEPDEVAVPEPPEKNWRWRTMSESRKTKAKKDYESELERREKYEQELKTWQESTEVHQAAGKLSDTVQDLEQRGLVQYDSHTRRHDLHPVVR